MALQYHAGQIEVQGEANTRPVAEQLAHWVGPVGEFASVADLFVLATSDREGDLRFASVYRAFDGLADFEAEISLLRAEHEMGAGRALLTTYDEAGYLASVGELERAPLKELSEAQSVELDALTRSSMAACLTERGGTLSAGGVATFPGGVDQLAVWDTCVAEVKATVAERVAELT